MSTNDRKYDLSNIVPSAGSRNGWRYKKFLRIGSAEIACPDGSVNLYGLYGVRGNDVFAQYCGSRSPDGITSGVNLMSSSGDMEPYAWSPADLFCAMWINGENVVREVTDES